MIEFIGGAFIGVGIFMLGFSLGFKEGVGVVNIDKVPQPSKEAAEFFSHPDDYPGEAGIVYRPSAQELDRMHEPQKIKEAKQAVEETLSNEQPIDL